MSWTIVSRPLSHHCFPAFVHTHTCFVAAAQETLSALVVKSQLIAHDVGEALDQSSDELVAAMPKCGPHIEPNFPSLNDNLLFLFLWAFMPASFA
jgi:hypothetical protein